MIMVNNLQPKKHNQKPKLAIIQLLIAVVCLLCSCSENDATEEEFPDWQNTNEAYFNTIAKTARTAMATGDKTWKGFLTFTKPEGAVATIADSIFVKVVSEGKGPGCPLSNDSVKVHYCGRLIPSKSYPEGKVFDKTFEGNVFDVTISNPYKSVVGSNITGFATALMHMHIGDHWIVYIPQQLAYGSADNGGIPPFSMLMFEIQLDSYSRIGTPLR